MHQAVKLQDAAEREAFLDWLWDFEFVRLELPVPDAVVFLDMPPEVSDRLIAARAKNNAARQKDIHEKDSAYLHRCHAAYSAVADKYGWARVQCSEAGEVRSIEDIHQDVYNVVKKVLGR